MQQTGYQVGDFMVQIQGGTNPMVAFGQQATQLVGVLYLMPPAMLAASRSIMGLSVSVGFLVMSLGIIIPIATAIGAYFMRMKDAAKDSSKSVSGFTSALSAFNAQADISRTSVFDLSKEFGDFADEIKRLSDTLASAAVFRALDSLNEGVTPFSESLAEAAFEVDRITKLMDTLREGEETASSPRYLEGLQRRLDEIGSTFGVLPSEISAFQSALSSVSNAKDLVSVRDNAAAALTLIEGMTFESGRMPPEIAKAVGELEKVLSASARATASINGTAAEAGGLADNLERAASTFNLIARSMSAIREAEAYSRRVGRGRGLSAGASAEEIRTNVPAAQLAAAAEKEQKRLSDLAEKASKAKVELTDLQKALESLNKKYADGFTPLDKYNSEIERLNEMQATGKLASGVYSAEVERLMEEFAKGSPIISSFSDAFEGFLNGSIKSFGDFTRKIFSDFRNLLAQMITTAARNQILFGGSVGGSMAGSAASAATGGAGSAGLFSSIGAGVGTFASSVGTGLGVVGSGFMAGGLGGAATASMGAISGGIGMGGLAGFGTALGAAIPIIGAVALVFGALRKTTKELDSGLNVTVKNMDALVTSFKTVETSRFFGLSKKTRTSTGGVSNEVSDPIVAAVTQIQQSVLDAAAAFGIGSDAFDKFSYQFKLSLKVCQRQQMQRSRD